MLTVYIGKMIIIGENSEMKSYYVSMPGLLLVNVPEVCRFTRVFQSILGGYAATMAEDSIFDQQRICTKYKS